MIALLLFLALRASTGADVTPNVPSLPLTGSNLEAPYASAASATTPQTDSAAPVSAPTGGDAMASAPAPSSWWSWLSPAPAAAPEESTSTPSGVPAPGPAADMAPGPAPSENYSGPPAAPSGSFLSGGAASPAVTQASASPSPSTPVTHYPSSSSSPDTSSSKGRTCANRGYTATPNGHPPPPPPAYVGEPQKLDNGTLVIAQYGQVRTCPSLFAGCFL
ncbi:g799 [Coccomyxa elongata]